MAKMPKSKPKAHNPEPKTQPGPHLAARPPVAIVRKKLFDNHLLAVLYVYALGRTLHAAAA